MPTKKPEDRLTLKISNNISSQELHATAFSIMNAIDVTRRKYVASIRADRNYRHPNYLLREVCRILIEGIRAHAASQSRICLPNGTFPDMMAADRCTWLSLFPRTIIMPGFAHLKRLDVPDRQRDTMASRRS